MKSPRQLRNEANGIERLRMCAKSAYDMMFFGYCTLEQTFYSTRFKQLK